MKGGNLIKTGIGIGVGLALFAGVACGQTADKSSENIASETTVAGATLDSELEKFYDPMSEIPLTFESQEIQGNTPNYVQNELVQQLPEGLLQFYDTLESRGFPALPDGVSELTITSIDTNYLLSKDNLEQKIQSAQGTIEHMKNFLSDTDLNFPEVEFVVAQNSLEVAEGIEGNDEGANIDRIVIYPIQILEYNIHIEGEAKYGNQLIPIEFTIKASKGGGEVNKRTHLSGKLGDLNVEFIYGNILWAQNGSSQLVFETPALEVLHAAIAPIAEQYAKQLVKEANTVEKALNAIQHSDLLDEYVVHGIGRYWFRNINDSWNLGFPLESRTSLATTLLIFDTKSPFTKN